MRSLHLIGPVSLDVQPLFPVEALLRTGKEIRAFPQVMLNSDMEQQSDGEVFCVSNVQLVSCEGDCADWSNDDQIPISALPPSCVVSDWILKKVEEIHACVGISCNGFEEQFNALLKTIESGCSSVLKSNSKKERELRRLECSINYDIKKGSGGRDRLKGRRSHLF